jgi:hypothetical protein
VNQHRSRPSSLEPDLEHCEAATGVEKRVRVEGSGEKCSGMRQLVGDVEDLESSSTTRTGGLSSS